MVEGSGKGTVTETGTHTYMRHTAGKRNTTAVGEFASVCKERSVRTPGVTHASHRNIGLNQSVFLQVPNVEQNVISSLSQTRSKLLYTLWGSIHAHVIVLTYQLFRSQTSNKTRGRRHGRWRDRSREKFRVLWSGYKTRGCLEGARLTSL